MSDPFVAEIRIFPFNFAPRGWAFCDGQLLPISQNTALFSLLGTNYGGNGQTTFALPNLQGSVPLFQGQGPGLSLYSIGETGGTPQVELLSTEMPAHTHAINASGSDASTDAPAGNAWGQSEFGDIFRDSSDVSMGQNALSPVGGGQPHNNVQPYLTLNFCIALQGIFPPRT